MQFTVERNVLNNFSTIGLKGRAKIMELDPGKLGHHPVRNPARQAACQPPIPPLGSPSADDVVSLFNFGHEGGDLFRVVLQVAIHGDDDLAARGIKACLQRRGLAKVPAQGDNSYAGVALIDFVERLQCVVRTAVVDEDNLIRFVEPCHHLSQSHVKWGDVRCLVVERHHNGKFHVAIHLADPLVEVVRARFTRTAVSLFNPQPRALVRAFPSCR